jgi:hypothetical protein
MYLAQLEFPLSAELGLPWFIGVILGGAKVLGVLTLTTRRFPTLREWAYAGFTFELLGAAACTSSPGSASFRRGRRSSTCRSYWCPTFSGTARLDTSATPRPSLGSKRTTNH